MIGRPSKYDPGIHTQLVYWMAKNGLTDIKIAEALHISKATLNNWKNKHSDFLDSIKQGKELVDTLVEGSLLKRALGFEFVETTKTRGEDGKLRTTKKVTKYIPGDVAAQFIWLKNRKSDEWRDRKEVAINSNMEKLMEIVGNV